MVWTTVIPQPACCRLTHSCGIQFIHAMETDFLLQLDLLKNAINAANLEDHTSIVWWAYMRVSKKQNLWSLQYLSWKHYMKILLLGKAKIPKQDELVK